MMMNTQWRAPWQSVQNKTFIITQPYQIHGGIIATIGKPIVSAALWTHFVQTLNVGSLLIFLIYYFLNGLYNQRPNKGISSQKGGFGKYGRILFKHCMQLAYWPQFMTSYMAFIIKGQTMAAVAFKDIFSDYGLFWDVAFIIFGLLFGRLGGWILQFLASEHCYWFSTIIEDI